MAPAATALAPPATTEAPKQRLRRTVTISITNADGK